MEKYKILLILLIFLAKLSNAQQLVYSTFLGGSGSDGEWMGLKDFAIDDSGTIYYAFQSDSINFPVTSDA